MRNAFINALQELARNDKRIFLLTGDLGFSVLENFREEFPDRLINMGVAEANMIGVAAGLALSGKIVYVYSIVPFVTKRCFEQICIDLCYQNLNVRIIGIGGGLSYGSAGPTHHSIEDISIMRSLPNMVVICPGDPIEAELTIKASLSYKGPLYIRLGKGKEPNIHKEKINFEIGKSIEIKEGNDLTIISTGNMLETAVSVEKKLKEKGISARIISMHTVKPIDKEAILKAAYETKNIFTIEEHSLIGGLGSAVAEILAESNYKILFKRFALPDSFVNNVGSQNYLRKLNQLLPDDISEKIHKIFKMNNIS